jgi:hypothetical protein
MAPQRKIPQFAPEPFTQWFRRRNKPPGTDGKHVLLFPDTFEIEAGCWSDCGNRGRGWRSGLLGHAKIWA